ncbi:PD-(D/E)XK nuclease family protein [Mesorhizobium sp.]|uniref:PD-(D/E)XK nuclease family protein n=1 Tax=Mesorhizobium sp. TaxID=1871066 RepID=UPI00122319E0|nr:PD-(D/E)XK nuclease family protein [Mesorhizobium sp.]TIP11324.1 MAG: PD-(D/E)XK nuclease family protein [Mesorhizobium sp.]
MRRLDAAREGATGRQILTLPLLAARLAGGFVAPATHETLYPVIRSVLGSEAFEDIAGVVALPGMPAAVLSSLREWWAGGYSQIQPHNSRLKDFVLLERCVREALPPGHLAPPDLLAAALDRVAYAPQVLGPVTLRDIVDIQPVWRPLILALSNIVPVQWILPPEGRGSWFKGSIKVSERKDSSFLTADVCADPRSEAREALRWARDLVVRGVAAPHEIAMVAASPGAWDDAFLVLSREAALPLHFSHGVPALATREGQTCAALADILLRGLTQERVRLLFARLPNSPVKSRVPADWAKGIRRSAALTSVERWRYALHEARGQRADGDIAEQLLLPILETLATGISSAEDIGRRLLSGGALTLWQDAMRMAPVQAIELSLRALRVDDGRDPGNSIVWAPARLVAAAPRRYVRLIGLAANAWPRPQAEDPLLPDHLLGDLRLPSAGVSDDDLLSFNVIIGQSEGHALSRNHRSATGSLQAPSSFWRGDRERVVGRSRIPAHAFSESDRLYARPADAGKDAHVRSSRACWHAWQDGEHHTAYDGRVRSNHPLLVEALAAVQSTTSLQRLLCDPLGFVWEHALFWREPGMDAEPLSLHPRAFGELVHALISAVIREGIPRDQDALSDAVMRAADRLIEDWPVVRAAPPHLLWHHTMAIARERAFRALVDGFGEMRGRSWTELPFGETVSQMHPWNTLAPVAIGETGLVFRGRIDRLDHEVSTGAAIITDYKVGSAPDRKRPVVFDRGAELQRVFYALAVRALLPGVRDLNSRLTYLRDNPARSAILAGEELNKAIEQAVSFATSGAQLQRAGTIAPGPPREFFDPLAIALPADVEGYRRTKRRAFAQVNAPLDKLWGSS